MHTSLIVYNSQSLGYLHDYKKRIGDNGSELSDCLNSLFVRNRHSLVKIHDLVLSGDVKHVDSLDNLVEWVHSFELIHSLHYCSE